MPYLAPQNAEEAFRFLDRNRPKIIAGCTDYFPSLQQGETHQDLLDISRISGLRGINRTDRGWRIGAATTWTDVVRADLPRAFDALKLAAVEVGSLQIQNQGTVAGNICNASPAADGVPPLLVLDAEVEIGSVRGSRTVALSEFIQGVRKVDLGPGEMVVAIHVPDVVNEATSSFSKLGSREYLVISIAMVAAVVQVEDGHLTDVRVAIGSCSPVAQRLPDLEALLKGKSVADLAEMDFKAERTFAPLSPISDVRGSAEYRLDVVTEMCRRVIMQACKGD
ncbi:xanthine dehydrogenase family protein subunit M [Aliiroseovarius sediminis]|uniref:FAD binding domain-containing protein n=1 Tax=Aliiroseovarius sediminis TaxID=2925839 RepID=UPI001F581D12|nr:xanthine dehydrogenase family protein subunit M [Aliiroseovarius sediminis]MCI2394846.1 xanthine dehydrogenase family protein subunit M [Aliiroseovarius sediminis]